MADGAREAFLHRGAVHARPIRAWAEGARALSEKVAQVGRQAPPLQRALRVGAKGARTGFP